MFQYYFCFGYLAKAYPMSGMKHPRAHSLSKVGFDAMKLVQNQLLPPQSQSKSLVPPPSMSPYPCPIFMNYFTEIPYEWVIPLHLEA
jgi:hypothetical protein